MQTFPTNKVIGLTKTKLSQKINLCKQNLINEKFLPRIKAKITLFKSLNINIKRAFSAYDNRQTNKASIIKLFIKTHRGID